MLGPWRPPGRKPHPPLLAWSCREAPRKDEAPKQSQYVLTCRLCKLETTVPGLTCERGLGRWEGEGEDESQCGGRQLNTTKWEGNADNRETRPGLEGVPFLPLGFHQPFEISSAVQEEPLQKKKESLSCSLGQTPPTQPQRLSNVAFQGR